MALKIVGSSPIIHPIKNKHPFRVLIFYGIRWIMGLEESGPPVRAGKKVSGGHFFSSGESPVCRTGGKQQEEETRWIMGLERPLRKHAGGMFSGRGRKVLCGTEQESFARNKERQGVKRIVFLQKWKVNIGKIICLLL